MTQVLRLDDLDSSIEFALSSIGTAFVKIDSRCKEEYDSGIVNSVLLRGPSDHAVHDLEVVPFHCTFNHAV